MMWDSMCEQHISHNDYLEKSYLGGQTQKFILQQLN